MKKLKRLDISENDFELPRDEIPDINFRGGYPPRDPNLKNNWRGRNRNNASGAFDLSSSETSNKEYSTLSIQKRHADETLNNNASNTQAMQVSQEVKEENWLDDDDLNSTSEKVSYSAEDEKGSVKSKVPEEEEKEEPQYCEEEQEEEEEEEPDDHEEEEELPSETLSPPRVNNPPISEECWDSEIIFGTEKRHNDGIFRHPCTRYSNADPHFFLPSDIHVPPIPRNTNWFYVEEGQFDDADDL